MNPFEQLYRFLPKNYRQKYSLETFEQKMHDPNKRSEYYKRFGDKSAYTSLEEMDAALGFSSEQIPGVVGTEDVEQKDEFRELLLGSPTESAKEPKINKQRDFSWEDTGVLPVDKIVTPDFSTTALRPDAGTQKQVEQAQELQARAARPLSDEKTEFDITTQKGTKKTELNDFQKEFIDTNFGDINPEARNVFSNYFGTLPQGRQKELMSKGRLTEKDKAFLLESSIADQANIISSDIDILLSRRRMTGNDLTDTFNKLEGNIELADQLLEQAEKVVPVSEEETEILKQRVEALQQLREESSKELERLMDTDEGRLRSKLKDYTELADQYNSVIANYPEELERRNELDEYNASIEIDEDDSFWTKRRKEFKRQQHERVQKIDL